MKEVVLFYGVVLLTATSKYNNNVDASRYEPTAYVPRSLRRGYVEDLHHGETLANLAI
jgi:hypothetical protein